MFLETLKRLPNTQLHLPVMATLERMRFSQTYMINIFPAFYSIDRHPTIHRVLYEYFDKDQNYYYMHADVTRDVGKVSALSIYLVDTFDLPSIQVLTKNMTMTFPEIGELTFCFENQCEIVRFLSTMIVLELKSIRV